MNKAMDGKSLLGDCPGPQKPGAIPSPLNYTGGKFKLLGQILPLFPSHIDTFLDAFCGGGNVGINVPAERVILNDSNPHLLALYTLFQHLGAAVTVPLVEEVIAQYGLSRSAEKGYAFYGCNSSAGLANFNRAPYLKLRADFNAKSGAHTPAILLYTLIVFAFNNQIRFNRKGEFNLPVGKRDFNTKMKAKLRAFITQLQTGKYSVTCQDFRAINTEALTKNSLVYCDPPYLISCATYNEQNAWNEESEHELLAFLDALNARGIPFALSNVLASKGRQNALLAQWAKQYRIIPLHHSYSNANYHRKDRSGAEKEVLIVNYGGEKEHG